jgi:hypothetical protein
MLRLHVFRAVGAVTGSLVLCPGLALLLTTTPVLADARCEAALAGDVDGVRELIARRADLAPSLLIGHAALAEAGGLVLEGLPADVTTPDPPAWPDCAAPPGRVRFGPTRAPASSPLRRCRT